MVPADGENSHKFLLGLANVCSPFIFVHRQLKGKETHKYFGVQQPSVLRLLFEVVTASLLKCLYIHLPSSCSTGESSLFQQKENLSFCLNVIASSLEHLLGMPEAQVWVFSGERKLSQNLAPDWTSQLLKHQVGTRSLWFCFALLGPNHCKLNKFFKG